MAETALADKKEIEAVPLKDRLPARNIYEQVAEAARRGGSRPALTFQLKSGEKDKAETLSWSSLLARISQAANLFRSLDIGEDDVVAFLLPNANETVYTLLGGMTAGIVNPINPLLDPEQIGLILKETKAKVLVTLAPFPKSDLAEKAVKAVSMAPCVEHVLTVNLGRYLTPPLSWIVPLIRPKASWPSSVKVSDFNKALNQQNQTLDFENKATPETICAYFHTGGTTGMPKVAQHNHGGALYQGWIGQATIITPDDVMLCPLPIFHVFAAYAVLFACIATGAHLVLPTPAGYRGDGVFDNFWRLVERWGVTFMITVPTAAAALMQRPVNADIVTLKNAFCGSAPLPQELFRQFEKTTGVKLLEGYGMTEATCVVSSNPAEGEKKIGSVGLPFPYTDVRIFDCAEDGTVNREMGTGEIAEICVKSPGVFPGYTDPKRNEGLFTPDGYLRTGDLGRFDEDGYLWITGRAKDLIIRGGHNIDPCQIEEALMEHPDVAFVGAIGQPDSRLGELPCAYVELKPGKKTKCEDILAFAKDHISEKAAVPKYVELLPELPKTAVGKVFKPALRKAAITRIYDAALKEAGTGASVSEVIESKETGLTAIIKGGDDDAVQEALGAFPRPWKR